MQIFLRKLGYFIWKYKSNESIERVSNESLLNDTQEISAEI